MVLTIERFSKKKENVPTNGIQRFDGDDCEKKGACCPQFGLTGLRTMAIMEVRLGPLAYDKYGDVTNQSGDFTTHGDHIAFQVCPF